MGNLPLHLAGGGGGGGTRTIIKQVSLHRLRMNVVHLVDSAQGIIDAIAEAHADTPRVRFVIEEDALGNYWDWGDNGIPGIIRDGDDGFWPDGEDLFYSVLTPADLPTAREIWYNNYSSHLPFLNIAPTNLKENFALYDSTEQSQTHPCLLYTSPSPRDRQKSRMPSSA